MTAAHVDVSVLPSTARAAAVALGAVLLLSAALKAGGGVRWSWGESPDQARASRDTTDRMASPLAGPIRAHTCDQPAPAIA